MSALSHKTTLILGAGISGLFCAIQAAKRGNSVIVIDHNKKPLRKLLLSGGGKCNITNLQVSEKDYLSSNPKFTRSALAGFTPAMQLQLLRDANILFEEREHGQIFCKRSATDMYDYFLEEVSKYGCHMHFEERCQHVSYSDGAFSIFTQNHMHIGSALVIATGSPAWPQCGASDVGFRIAEQFGHTLIPPRPVLCGLHLPARSPLQDLAGISHNVTLTHVSSPTDSLLHKDVSAKKIVAQKRIVAQNLALLFTHKGISGPAVLQASLYWQPKDALLCNFIPDFSRLLEDNQNIVDYLLKEPNAGKQLLKNLCKHILPQRLFEALIPHEIANVRAAELNKERKQRVHSLLTTFSFAPSQTEGLKKAEACAGGVHTKDISSKNFESALQPGLFFCGEVLDVTGRLGGYNIHWAFASGYATGTQL